MLCCGGISRGVVPLRHRRFSGEVVMVAAMPLRRHCCCPIRTELREEKKDSRGGERERERERERKYLMT